MTILTSRLIPLLCSLLLAPLAFANIEAPNQAPAVEKQYQIELIIFSQINQRALLSEQWPKLQPVTTDPSGAYQLIPASETKPLETEPLDTEQLAYTLLPDDQFKLMHAQANLNRNPLYQTITHFAWIQTVPPPNQTEIIHINAGALFDEQGNPIQPIDTNPESDSLTGEQQEPLPTNTHQVTGTLAINLDRYFNLSVDLVFSEPSIDLAPLVPPGYFGPNPGPLLHFRLLQSRRMKSGELDYIDHPLYGILVEIFPIEPAEHTDQDTPPQDGEQQKPLAT